MSGTGSMPTGYLNRGYAEACAEFGTPTELQRCGGWYLKRTIPGSAALDGMGCYPLFACRDWARLAEDIDALAGELVDRKSTRLNSSHIQKSRMPSSA